MSDDTTNGQRLLTGVGRWAPSSQVLSLWALWWLWRYSAISALPGFDAASGSVALGFLLDALALDGLCALLRWRHGDLRARERTSPWSRHIFGGLLITAALLRAVDGLHCFLANRHVEPAFWDTLGQSAWSLRYVLIAALGTGLAAWWLLGQEVRRAARLADRLEPTARARWVHVDAMRAAFGLVVAAWLTFALSDAASVWVAPSEWWTISSLFGP